MTISDVDGGADYPFSPLLVAVLAASVVIPIGLYVWARWLSKRDGVPRIFAALPISILVIVGLDLVSLGWIATTTFMILSPELAGDPAERATQLAKGISEMMNCHGLALVLMLLVAPVLGVATLAWKFRWRK